MSSITSLPFASWPAGRKVAAALFVASGCVALACAALYMAGVIFLVLNKADPRQASSGESWTLGRPFEAAFSADTTKAVPGGYRKSYLYVLVITPT